MTNSDNCPFCEAIFKTLVEAICCDLCSKWIHIKCHNINNLNFENIKIKDETTIKLVFRKFSLPTIRK